jgi:hypothetical protein
MRKIYKITKERFLPVFKVHIGLALNELDVPAKFGSN